MMRSLKNRTYQIAMAALSVIALVFLIQTFGKAYRPQGFDLTGYLDSAAALMHGQNPYQTASPFPYLYPLTLAFLLIPLTVIPYWLAVFIWYVVSVVSLVLVAKVLGDLVCERYNMRWGRWSYVLLAGMSVALAPILQNNLLNGQVNFVVLLLCVLCLKFHLDKRDVLSSATLAVAIAIKIVPAILLLFLVVRRRYGAALLTIGLAGAFCLVPALLLGRQAPANYLEWGRHMAALASTPSPEKGTMFFTLHGFLSYLFPGLINSFAATVASIAAVIIAAVGLDANNRGRAEAACDAWAFSEYLLAILLILPISETHHLAFLIPAALLVVLRSVLTAGLSRSQRYGIPVLFSLLFWAGKADKNGPMFFLAIVVLFVCVGVYLTSCRKVGA